jgi:sphinganine-1-phosphate aldolase
LTEIINEAMARFTVSNPLHPDVFPGVRKMEAEIVSMCLNLFNGPNGAGTSKPILFMMYKKLNKEATSGGTESILMSVKTHRDWARKTKGITEPEMYVAVARRRI